MMVLANWLLVIGLGALFAFASTSRHVMTVPVSSLCGYLTIPAAIALIWRGALMYHWWILLIVPVVGALVGLLNGVMVRRGRKDSIYAAQPLVGVVFVVASVACWFV